MIANETKKVCLLALKSVCSKNLTFVKNQLVVGENKLDQAS